MKPLAAEGLANDPRVRRARTLLGEALADHTRAIGDIRPPDPARGKAHADRVAELGRLRGNPLLLPFLSSGLGHGPFVELTDGSVKLDLISGIGVHFLGHGHPLLAGAVCDAALDDVVMQGNLQQTSVAIDLEAALLGLANGGGAGLDHVFLTTSGATANENALKMAFQARAPADRLLAFTGGFAGRTLALAHVTDRPAYRDGLPTTLAVDHVPFFDPADSHCTDRSLAVLREHLARHPGRHAAMVFELVQGEAGTRVGDPAFFMALMDEVRTHDVAIFVDEVQTFGRTHRPFAFQHFGLDDRVDLVTVGKMTQVCATLYRRRLAPRPGLVSQTFTGASAALRAARTVLERLAQGDLYGLDGKNALAHRWFADRLGALAEKHPKLLRGPFGVGAMVAFTPLDGSAATAKEVVTRLFDAGVVGFMAGHHPSRVRFLLPTPVLEEAHAAKACDLLGQVLADVHTRGVVP